MKLVPLAAGVLLLAACGGGHDLASQIAPGSAVVPCSQIMGLVRAIEPYYSFPGPADSTPLYGLETSLAAKFSNVSNLDPPAALSGAEVSYQLDVLDNGDADPTQNQPFRPAVETDIQALASACGQG
jgi:hypothetical protein